MRNKPTNNLLLHDFFFYVGYSVWIVVTAFLITVPALSQITTVLKFFSILCWILAIVFYKWYFKQLLLYTLFIFFSLIIFYFSRVIIVIILPIVLMASSEIDIKKIAKVDLFVRSICVFLTFISYCLGMSPGNDIPSTWSVLDIRYSLGYYHPNNLFAQIFVICAAILVCYSKRIGVLHYFILFFFVVLFGVITQSRTGMLVLCLTIVLVSLRRKIKFSRLFTYCIHYSFIIFLFISFVSSVFYEKSNIIFRFINQLLSGRIEFASRQLNNYGISLLGQKINYTSTLDSKYSSVQPLIVDNYPQNIVICTDPGDDPINVFVNDSGQTCIKIGPFLSSQSSK